MVEDRSEIEKRNEKKLTDSPNTGAAAAVDLCVEDKDTKITATAAEATGASRESADNQAVRQSDEHQCQLWL